MTNLAALLHFTGGDQAEAAQWMEASIAILVRYRLPRDAGGQTLEVKQAFLAQLAGQSAAQPDEQPEGLTLEQLLALVRQARDGDDQLAGQLRSVLEQLAGQPDAPPEHQVLARVLLQLLAGEPAPDLSSLPTELRPAVAAAFDLPEV